MRGTCFHMLKIASDGTFYLLFGDSKLASAKFDSCIRQYFLFEELTIKAIGKTIAMNVYLKQMICVEALT